jgi:hypothetical protein
MTKIKTFFRIFLETLIAARQARADYYVRQLTQRTGYHL